MHILTLYILGIHHREHICTYLSTFMEMSFTLYISNNTESIFPPLSLSQKKEIEGKRRQEAYFLHYMRLNAYIL
jgi:hypothetical protein